MSLKLCGDTQEMIHLVNSAHITYDTCLKWSVYTPLIAMFSVSGEFIGM